MEQKYSVKEFKEIKISDDIKEVTSEEEYWEYHKIYLKKIRKLQRQIKKMIYDPLQYINEFEIIYAEMIGYGIVSLEFANEQREKLYKELSNPKEFKQWFEDTKLGKKVIKRLRNNSI